MANINMYLWLDWKGYKPTQKEAQKQQGDESIYILIADIPQIFKFAASTCNYRLL